MLPPEYLAVIIRHMRHSMMSKSQQVLHTAEKCFRLRHNLIRDASRCREDAVLLSPLQNKQHSLMNAVRLDEGHKKEPAQEQRLLLLAQEQYRMSGAMQEQLSGVASGLMRSADTLLFTLLKAQHYQWRDRLYMSLLTGETADVLSEETACPLGQWLHGEGRRRFSALPGFRELNACHHDMHHASGALFAYPVQAIPVTRLETLLRQTEDISLRLIALLEQLDERVSLLYPDDNCQRRVKSGSRR